MNRAAKCCALCQSFKNCTYFTYSAGGTPSKPICYNKPGGCCFLNTAAASAGKRGGCDTCTAGSTKPLPVPPAPIFAMPYLVHDSGKKGVLLVSKSGAPLRVTLAGVGNTTVQALDGSLDGKTLDPEPGFVPPVDRPVGLDGVVHLGPYGVAIVHVQ